MEPSGHSGAALIAWSKPTAFFLPGDQLCSILKSRCVQRRKLLVPRWQAVCYGRLVRGARKLYAMSGKKRNPNHSIGDQWKHLHRVEHDLAARFSLDLRDKAWEVKHRFAGHFARLQRGSLPFVVLSLVTWLGGGSNRRTFAKLKDKWHGLHPQMFNLTAGVGSLFWKKVFEEVVPDQLIVTPNVLAGHKLLKTVLLGCHPGLVLLHVHLGEQPEQFCRVGEIWLH